MRGRRSEEKTGREKTVQQSKTETETGNRDSPAGGVGGAGIGSRKGRGPTPVGRTGAVQLHPPGAHTHKRNKKQNSPGIVDCSVIM